MNPGALANAVLQEVDLISCPACCFDRTRCGISDQLIDLLLGFDD